jgi:hypothetical protein
MQRDFPHTTSRPSKLEGEGADDRLNTSLMIAAQVGSQVSRSHSTRSLQAASIDCEHSDHACCSKHVKLETRGHGYTRPHRHDAGTFPAEVCVSLQSLARHDIATNARTAFRSQHREALMHITSHHIRKMAAAVCIHLPSVRSSAGVSPLGTSILSTTDSDGSVASLGLQASLISPTAVSQSQTCHCPTVGVDSYYLRLFCSLHHTLEQRYCT